MARERLDVGHELRGPRRRRRPAHAAAEDDGLARHLALERAEDQLWLRRLLGIEGVESCRRLLLVGTGMRRGEARRGDVR